MSPSEPSPTWSSAVSRNPSVETSSRVGQYQLGETIGTGSFGKVVIAYAENGKEYAIKIMERKGMETDIMRRLKQEVAILKEVKHPCIVDLKEVLSTDDRIYLVFQLMRGGEVWKPGVPLSEASARVHLQRLCEGLAWCHNKGISHRDLKPENLLLNDAGELCIADFGLSALRSQTNGMLFTFCGSPNFVAPEVLREAGYDGMQSDVWSVGVIMFALLCGHLPFDDARLHQLTRKILHGEFALPAHLSHEASDLLARILVVDPSKRATVAAIRQHPWMQHGYMPVEPHVLDVHDALQVARTGEAITKVEMTRRRCTVDTAPPQHVSSLNAFDLITLSSALNFDNLFVYTVTVEAAANDGSAHRALPTLALPAMRHTSRAPPEELLSRVASATMQLSRDCRAFLGRSPSGRSPIIKLVSAKAKNLVVHVEVFQLTPTLNLLEVRHKLGSQLHFKQLCNELLGELADVLLFRPEPTASVASSVRTSARELDTGKDRTFSDLSTSAGNTSFGSSGGKRASSILSDATAPSPSSSGTVDAPVSFSPATPSNSLKRFAPLDIPAFKANPSLRAGETARKPSTSSVRAGSSVPPSANPRARGRGLGSMDKVQEAESNRA